MKKAAKEIKIVRTLKLKKQLITPAEYPAYYRFFNCCQSVLAAFAQDIGLTEEQACSLGEGFGAGMQCGSVFHKYTADILILLL